MSLYAAPLTISHVFYRFNLQVFLFSWLAQRWDLPLRTFKAVFPNHGSAEHRYGLREKRRIK